MLTLREQQSRREQYTALLGRFEAIRLPCEVYYGVNGKEITIKATHEPNMFLLFHEGECILYNRTVRANGQQMSAGEFGCAWSHYNIYKKLIMDPEYDHYIVLEDDAEMTVDDEYFKAALQNLPSEYDICRICKSTWYPYSKEVSVNEYFYTYAKRYTNHTTAYIISKKGANKVLLYCNNQFNVPADDILSNMNLHSPEFSSYAPERIMFQESGAPSVLKAIDSST
jgi:GR25 family glycosyltransferase involved in LPS biosynthesis